MKKVFFMSFALFLLHSCCKKTETPDYSALIVGKWVVKNYQKDGGTLDNRKPYMLSTRYETGWQFSADKQVQYRVGTDWLSFIFDSYSVVENKTLVLNHGGSSLNSSTSNIKIIELTEDKLTVYNDLWETTFYLVRE
jgi:hypothetical protein